MLLAPITLHSRLDRSRSVDSPVPPAPETVDTVIVASPKRAPGLWEVPLWVLALVLVMIIPHILLGVISALAPSAVTDTPSLVLADLGGLVCSLGLGLLAVRVRLGRDWPRQLNLRLPSFLRCLLALFCLPGLMLVANAAGALTRSFSGTADASEAILETAAALPLWLALLTVAVGPAFIEELWCRGFFGRGLVGRYGAPIGVLLTSLIFGLLHGNLPQGVFAFVFGIGLHLIYLATRSLWVPVL